MDEYLQQIYEDAFQNAYEGFQLRKRNDETFTRSFFQGLLESMYVAQGNNWLGRGEAKEASQNAMIAAAELLLSEWVEEPRDDNAIAN